MLATSRWQTENQGEVGVLLNAAYQKRTVRHSYYGVESRPQSSWVNDRQVMLSMTFKL